MLRMEFSRLPGEVLRAPLTSSASSSSTICEMGASCPWFTWRGQTGRLVTAGCSPNSAEGVGVLTNMRVAWAYRVLSFRIHVWLHWMACTWLSFQRRFFFFLTCPLQGFLFVAAPSPLPTHTQHFYSLPATPASLLRAALRSERKPIKKAPNFRLLPFYLFFFSFLALTYLPFGSVLVSLTLFLGSVFKFKRLSKSQLFLNKLFFKRLVLCARVRVYVCARALIWVQACVGVRQDVNEG